MLLNCGASMEDRDPDGKSPLIMAACHGHVGLLQLLLTRGDWLGIDCYLFILLSLSLF